MPDAPLHRIKRVTVKKLFGIYDHTIDLNVADRVTIIHGPNGVGKTVVLRLMSALFSERLFEFGRIPLESFQVELTDGTSIIIEGRPNAHPERSHRSTPPLHLTLRSGGATVHEGEVDYGRLDAERLVMFLQSQAPWLERVGEDRWLDEHTGEYLTTNEAWMLYRDALPKVGSKGAKIPGWFTSFRDQVKLHLIETQRLLRVTRPGGVGTRYRSEQSRMVPTVRDYAKDLQIRVTETLARYASESQALDQSFPQRLLLSPSNELLPIDEIKTRMSALELKRAKLKQIGLLDDNASNPFDTAELDKLDTTQRRAMTLYVSDTEEKLAVLNDLARRIELLRDTVNAKFKNKAIRFDRERGFTAVGNDSNPLDLDALSSGEQHELVLLYDLLFRVQPNTLVLIDEPELSLHVVWQKRFLPDLLEIVKTAEFDALIATHSPFIVGDRSDLMVPLAAEPA